MRIDFAENKIEKQPTKKGLDENQTRAIEKMQKRRNAQLKKDIIMADDHEAIGALIRILLTVR